MNGTFYAVGVGPGDPALMTVQAIRILKDADVLCLPQASKETCRAYRTACAAVPEIANKACLCPDFPMTRDESVLEKAHRESYAAVRTFLASQKSVAFITLGDPTVYSTAFYLLQKAQADGFPVRVVNGIPSFCASAASLCLSLCEKNEQVHILSGQDDVENALCLPGTKILMKCGKNMEKLLPLLKRQEKEKNARVFAVRACTAEEEACFSGANNIPADGAYMLTVIVKSPGA